jgi:hypothetical protein
MAAQPLPVQTRHLQLAKSANSDTYLPVSANKTQSSGEQLRLEQISAELRRKEASRLQALAPVAQNIGLIELDVALTRLAIANPNIDSSRIASSDIDAEASASAPDGQTLSSEIMSGFGYGAAPQQHNPNSSRNTFFRWGQAHNKRSFALKEDGSAQYMVKMGETIISIVECLLREKHRMFTNYEPTYREIRAEISSLRAANPQVVDLDLLQTGQWVTIPAIVVCEALTGRGRLAS